MASQAAVVDVNSLKPSFPPYGDFRNYHPLLRNDIPPPYVGFDLEAYKCLFPQAAAKLGVVPFTKDFLEQMGHVYEPDFDQAAAWGDEYWHRRNWIPEDWKRVMEVYEKEKTQGRIDFHMKYRRTPSGRARFEQKGWAWPMGPVDQEIFPHPYGGSRKEA